MARRRGQPSWKRPRRTPKPRQWPELRAIVVEELGGPEVLQLAEHPSASAGPGELLVDVSFAGVNYRDVYERIGRYGVQPPFVAGTEGAGTVVAAAEGSSFHPGDRITWATAAGTYAEQAVVAEEHAVAIPDGVSDEIAAAVLLQGMTAHYLCTSTYPVQAGETVVVHAGAGGVGRLLTGMAKRLGAQVIATTSTPEKAAIARAAGADETIEYEGFDERVRELTGGAGAHAVFDGIGKSTFAGSLASLRPRGMLALYGAASGNPDPVAIPALHKGSLFLTRPTLTDYTQSRSELLQRAAQVFDWVEDGTLDVLVSKRYALADAATAHRDLEARRTVGKLLLSCVRES
jgi:NADPH2:quinone reductase